MANNFVNRVKANISAEESLPTEVYYHATKKAICIELDAANKSSAGVTVGVSVEDTSALTGSGISVALSGGGASAGDGIFSKSTHNLSVNDRLLFAGSVPNIASGSAGGDTSLNVARYYFVQSVPNNNTFTISETRSATTPIKFSGTGSSLTYKVVAIADIVRSAPVPVGGSLKVISGQKLVLEATDRIFAHCSSAKNVDVICSMLEDVS
tara:strand:+ start:566 stop:1195 length:630 start_codon:yes stop_codon:yes gene_type:complete